VYFVNGNGREAVSQFLVHVILVSTRGSHLSKTSGVFSPSDIVNDRTEKDRTEWCTTVAEGEKITKKGVGRGEGLHSARDKKEPSVQPSVQHSVRHSFQHSVRHSVWLRYRNAFFW
jgi:hypothetical protein